jgi:hypothetical protein
MQNLSDEELDDRMKQAGEFEDYAYDEASWQNIKARLDNDSGAALWMTPTRIISGVVVLLLLLSGIWFYTLEDKPTIASGNIVNGNISPLSDSHTTKSNEQISQSSIETEESKPATEIIKPELSVKSTKQNTFQKKQERLFAITASPQAVSAPVSTRAVEQTDVTISNVESNADGKQPDDKNAQQTIEEQEKEKSLSAANFSSLSHQKPVSVDSAVQEVKAIEEVKEEALEKDSVAVEKQEEEKKEKSGLWSVKLSISPDWSAQSFSETSDLGFNYGLAIEYKLTNTIGVSAGVLRARKFYTARNIEYRSFMAEYAEGNCNMWDIPIQLNYYKPTNRALQVFGSLGLSSYLMSKESYTYYPYAAYPSISYSSEVRNENSEWFKVLNFSVGLQHPIGPSLIFQVEPFVKVPLDEMGIGNVAISSIGLFLNLRYQLKK